MKVHEAEAIRDEEVSWVCPSCDTFTDEHGKYAPHCDACGMYWADCANGMFDEPFPGGADHG